MASPYLCWPCGAHCWDDGYCSALSWAAPPRSSLQVYSALCRGVHAWLGVPGSGCDWSESVFRGRGCRGALGRSLKGVNRPLFHTHFHGHRLLIYCNKAQKRKKNIKIYADSTSPHSSTGVEYKMAYLLGLLHGEGLDCAEAEELVLRLLSGLLREHTRSMFREPVHASHSGLPLHLSKTACHSILATRVICMQAKQNLMHVCPKMTVFSSSILCSSILFPWNLLTMLVSQDVLHQNSYNLALHNHLKPLADLQS